MKIIKNKDHYLLKNEFGEYHLSIEEFERLGEEGAVALAKEEIEKKLVSSYTNKTISFQQAQDLGFCKYGIEDFCEMLSLDISGEYEVEELNKKLTLKALKKYPYECIKLFGKNTLKYLGGVSGILSEETVDLVLRPEFIDEETLHKLSVRFAYQCLENFEKVYPDDDRPRKAIQTKEMWIKGCASDKELSAASLAAWSARSVARSAAESVARSAAWSAWSAELARSAARKEQVRIILSELGLNEGE